MNKLSFKEKRGLLKLLAMLGIILTGTLFITGQTYLIDGRNNEIGIILLILSIMLAITSVYFMIKIIKYGKKGKI